MIADGIIPISTICEGSSFRIIKARQGTKYVILKVPVVNDSMSEHLLRREWEIAKDLHHPCIVTTTGFLPSDQGGPAIVMEDIEGVRLDEFMAGNPSPLKRKALLDDIIEGVSYLHHKGILHNDLKPSNILVNTNGAARIIDFGLSVSDDGIYGRNLGGSDGFSAPEILDGRGPCGAASDIYSIGLLIKLISTDAGYSRIAEKCSYADPANRFQSINELKTAIRRSSRMPLIIALALIVAAVCAIAVYPVIKSTRKENIVNDTMSQIEAQTAESFNSAVSKMKACKYREFASLERGRQQLILYAILDSVSKAHPNGSDGTAAPEVIAVTKILTKQLDSMMALENALPAFRFLPDEDSQLKSELYKEYEEKGAEILNMVNH